MNEIYLSLKPAGVIGLIVGIITVAVILTIHFALRFNELKKQSETDNDIICNNLIRLVNQGIEIEMLKDHNSELKKSFEDAVAEITELRSKSKESEDELRIAYERINILISQNSNLTKSKFEIIGELKVLESKCILIEEINSTLRKRLSRSHVPKDAKGHFQKVGTVKEVESDWWELINDQDYMKELFNTGKRYQISNIKPSKENLLFLIGNDNQPYLVYKKDFKPVQE